MTCILGKQLSNELTPAAGTSESIPLSSRNNLAVTDGDEALLSLEPPSWQKKYAAVWATLSVLLIVLVLTLPYNAFAGFGFWNSAGIVAFYWLEIFLLCRFGNCIGSIRCRSELHNLTLSANGLQWHCFKKPLRKNRVPWSDLRFVWTRQRRDPFSLKPKKTSTYLVIDCPHVADYPINLDRLSASQREKLFLTLSRYVPQDLFSPEALFLQVQSLSGNGAVGIGDFTQIWAEEFNRRFELANHVTLPPGHVCSNGRYTIGMLIATRINSSAYLAHDRQGNRIMIKELVVPVQVEAATQAKVIEQFDRETRILAGLDHRSIVKIRDHFVENGRSYIVMDCAAGRNLREHVRLNGKVSEENTLDIATELVDVLQYLHHQQPPVLHRDFTPDNLIYSVADRQVKVIDFGAANLYETEGTATLVGKQNYMPPEQFKGKPAPASDVYAFGATLLFLLTATEPLRMGKMAAGALNDISPPLQELIRDCTDFDLQRRPTCDELMERLTSIRSAEHRENCIL